MFRPFLGMASRTFTIWGDQPAGKVAINSPTAGSLPVQPFNEVDPTARAFQEITKMDDSEKAPSHHRIITSS